MKIHYTTLTGIDNDTGKWQTGVIFASGCGPSITFSSYQ